MAMPRGPVCFLVCLGFVGVFFLALFATTIATLSMYTPLYTPMTCNNTEKVFGKEVFDPVTRSVVINGTSTTICSNPNRIAFFMRPREGDTTMYLVLGKNVSDIGWAKNTPKEFPPGGDAVLHTDIGMVMNTTQVGDMLMYSRNQGYPMMATATHVWGQVEIKLYGMPLRSPWRPASSWCGWRIDPKTKVGGPVVCDFTLEALQGKVPGPYDEARPFLVYVPETKLAQAEELRNWFCSIVMVISFGMLVAVMACMFRRYRQHMPQKYITRPVDDDDLLKIEEGMAQEATHDVQNGVDAAVVAAAVPGPTLLEQGGQQIMDPDVKAVTGEITRLRFKVHRGPSCERPEQVLGGALEEQQRKSQVCNGDERGTNPSANPPGSPNGDDSEKPAPEGSDRKEQRTPSASPVTFSI
eukprot:TRINITY_DN101385_c0_g1_i1.p1 TRINITY_DN101385_c0_g1~~TRINITY_DN101385_c0_g1_i1.p1  ORF type:complete len:435 (+),score=64.56 TRINITY_DN101385_c0_g1_i1:73-1305(+)